MTHATQTANTPIIIGILQSTFGTSEWNADLIVFTAGRIEKSISEGGRDMVRNITNDVWNNFSGGDTAEATAQKIVAALNLGN